VEEKEEIYCRMGEMRRKRLRRLRDRKERRNHVPQED